MTSKIVLEHNIWAIVPAAGIGRRMQSAIPKQYLILDARPVLELTINTLLQNDYISGLVIALQEDDPYWADIKLASTKPVLRSSGGKERSDSVLNALNELVGCKQFNETDWVMVHDAVRPCLAQSDISKLVSEVSDSNGGLLALPVRDTMKRQSAISCVVETTVDRDKLWHALTPQYFPALRLKQALEKALKQGLPVTDESSAMELSGFKPMLVQGKEDNIKITRPDDLRLASMYLQARNSDIPSKE